MIGMIMIMIMITNAKLGMKKCTLHDIEAFCSRSRMDTQLI